MGRACKYIFFLLLATTVACNSSHDDISPVAESLCTSLFSERYCNVARLDSIADEIDTIADGNNELISIADNASAYAAMMSMDYSAAERMSSCVPTQ